MLSIVPEDDYSRDNETKYREDVRRRLDKAWLKTAHLILPLDKYLGFTGSTGKVVRFGLDGSDNFTITVDDITVLTLATTTDLTTLAASLQLLWEADDSDLYALVTTEYMVEVDDINGRLSASYSIEVDVNGRISSLRLQSDGSTADVIFKADTFKFYDGVNDVALFSAAAGLVTINGDLAVSGSIVVGDVRWPVSLQQKEFTLADGEAIDWANGAALTQIPNYTILLPTGVALAAGEAWEPPTLQSVTTTGATLRLKISTPGATSTVTDTTDSAGGGGDPDRVMDKSDAADAYNGYYSFRVQGTITILSEPTGGGTYYHDGEVELTTWFDDGGGWDQGPTIRVSALDALGFSFSGSSLTGSQSYDVTKSVAWGNAVGQHGGKEYGVDYVSGGSLVDFVSVEYIKQATAGTRTGSPNGEPATVLVTPKNEA